MQQIAFEVPINGLSFGQTAINILKEVRKRGLAPSIFPIGNLDMAAYPADEEFKAWLTDGINKAVREHKRAIPVIKLWHINGSFHSVSEKQHLFTFHETDTLTEYERNVLQNQQRVFVSCNFTKQVFNTFGVDNVTTCPLGFDKDSFKVIPKKSVIGDVTTWAIYGKLEKRKNHAKMISTWAKKYGNNNSHILHLAIFNPFLPIDQQNRALMEVLEGKYYHNINTIGYCQTNAAYNVTLNNADIVIACSGGEGYDLPLFQSLCLGKHAVVLKAHAYLDYCNADNATFVNPSGKVDAHDGVFFQKGAVWNQGQFFDFKPEELVEAMEKSLQRFQKQPINEAGTKLAAQLTWDKTVDTLLAGL